MMSSVSILIAFLLGYLASAAGLLSSIYEGIVLSHHQEIANKRWILLAFILIAALYVVIFIPIYKVACKGVQSVELGPYIISARQELQRRGSWPVAYSNKFAKKK
eukprot:GILI01019989.1.p1 GENE.GILI01019989.1~~GILI01019989.1.p1  ORF type:complete len:105 (+),score=18.48 GILI01019989.1:37-351(+)